MSTIEVPNNAGENHREVNDVFVREAEKLQEEEEKVESTASQVEQSPSKEKEVRKVRKPFYTLILIFSCFFSQIYLQLNAEFNRKRFLKISRNCLLTLNLQIS